MTVRSALYYPNTKIRSPNLLKTALLTWDKLELIVPFDGFRVDYEDSEMAEAVDVVGQHRVLSQKEQLKIRSQVTEILSHGPIPTLKREAPKPRQPDYVMWARKFDHETWQLLEDCALATRVDDKQPNQRGPYDDQYSVAGSVGLTLMSMAADVAAGKTRTCVTDAKDAYETIADFPMMSARAQPGADADYVVHRTIKALNLRDVPLRNLIDLRKREARESGSSLRQMRHAYLDMINSHVEDLATHDYKESDRAEVERVFAQEVSDNFKQLNEAFRLPTREMFQDLATFGLASGATIFGMMGGNVAPELTVPAMAMPVLVGGILLSRSRFGARRAEILRSNPMAYLYHARG